MAWRFIFCGYGNVLLLSLKKEKKKKTGRNFKLAWLHHTQVTNEDVMGLFSADHNYRFSRAIIWNRAVEWIRYESFTEEMGVCVPFVTRFFLSL